MKILGSKTLRLDQLNRPSPTLRPERSKAGFERLRRSIRATGGPLMPLVVTLLGKRRGKEEYAVVSGEGRLAAMEEEGFPPDHPVPCIAVDASDEEAWELRMLENSVREDLTPFQLAAAARVLVKDYGRKPSGAPGRHSTSWRSSGDGAVGPHPHYRLRAQAPEVGDADPEEIEGMKCSIEGCPGEYEKDEIVHTVRFRGQVIVIDRVPADVCSVCGDVLLDPETIRRVEALLRTPPSPTGTVPLYKYA